MYRFSGMGATPSPCDDALVAWSYPSCWSKWWSGVTPNAVAPPGVPSGSHGEVALPPAGSSGGITLPTTGTPDDVVTGLVNQQSVDQQAIDAANLQGSWIWSAAGAMANAGDAVTKSIMSPWMWLAVGLGVFGVVAVAAGNPRRYGR